MPCLDIDTNWNLLSPVPGVSADQGVVGEGCVARVADHHRHLAHAVHELDRGDDAMHGGAGVTTRPHTCAEMSLSRQEMSPLT